MFDLSVGAQISNLKNYYSSPLNIPLSLSGNFCEIRTNHFHSGIDLRTYGKEGQAVLSAADGYVSRIKVSAMGYGKALYITHPNGTTTVYGHLKQFSTSIQQYVEQNQNALQKFEVELFPDSMQFIVHKAELIAISGNSGGSEAPHLHFEIRNRYTEEPLNPLLFGISIPDTTFPVFTHVAIYTRVDGEQKRLTLLETRALNDSVYAVDDTIKIPSNISNISVAFAAFDKAFALDSNDVGIYSATLINENDTVFNFSYNRLNFSDTKYVNAHIDYEAKILQKIKLERCFNLPGDAFPTFRNAGKGAINFMDNMVLNPRIIIRDFNGHSSTLLLEIQKDSSQLFSDTIQTNMICYEVDHLLKSEHSSVFIQKGSLYQDIKAEAIIEVKAKSFYSVVVKVFDKTIPLHKNAELKIRANKVPKSLQSKVLIVGINDQNKISGSIGGVYNNGWVITKISSFGKFAITVDTIAPTINHQQITIDSICMCPVLSVKITDDLSAIENYIGCIDNEWALMEQDLKSDRLIYFIKPQILGPHQLTISAADKKGNWFYFASYY